MAVAALAAAVVAAAAQLAQAGQAASFHQWEVLEVASDDWYTAERERKKLGKSALDLTYSVALC